MRAVVGVLALQGAFREHLTLLKRAYHKILLDDASNKQTIDIRFIEVRSPGDLLRCDALVIPGGESTTMALVAVQSHLLEPLRTFVKIDRKPTWGTCAGLILLAEAANQTKKGGQDLIGGLDVRVNRNHFGRQAESFQADLNLEFLATTGDDQSNSPFPGVFIRAPIVEKILPRVDGIQSAESAIADTVVAPSRQIKNKGTRLVMIEEVKVMATLPEGARKTLAVSGQRPKQDQPGDIIAVKQGNVFGTSFHPELTTDARIHIWWLMQVLEWLRKSDPTNGQEDENRP